MTQQDRDGLGKFMLAGEEALVKTPICVRFPLSIAAVLAEMSEKSNFIRIAVAEKMEAQGLLEGLSQTDSAEQEG